MRGPTRAAQSDNQAFDNRALYLPERKKLMQDWADLLDTFKKHKVVRRAA